MRRMPTMNRLITRELPPKLKNGKGRPLVGISPITTARLSVICRAKSVVMP